ncbi:MAG: hypothetical protein MUE96_03515 [Bacteroidia bacterium]|jgi:hypothetical protein|nr:hypothetical protein [Bacteroidia bacterium]
MKNLYLILLSLVLLSACSEKRFAFRKKVRVDKEEQLAQASKPTKSKVAKQQKEVATASETPILDTATASADYNNPSAALPAEQLSAGPSAPIENEQIWKEEVAKPKQEKQVEKKQKKSKTQSQNGFAIAGFIFSLVGLFFFPILFCTLGIIFSAIGIKSDYRGLAIAGVILGVVGLVLWLVLVAMVI